MWYRVTQRKIDICRDVVQLVTFLLILTAIFKLKSTCEKLPKLAALVERYEKELSTDRNSAYEKLTLFNNSLAAFTADLRPELLSFSKQCVGRTKALSNLFSHTFEHINQLGRWGPFYAGDYVVHPFQSAAVNYSSAQLSDCGLSYYRTCWKSEHFQPHPLALELGKEPFPLHDSCRLRMLETHHNAARVTARVAAPVASVNDHDGFVQQQSRVCQHVTEAFYEDSDEESDKVSR